MWGAGGEQRLFGQLRHYNYFQIQKVEKVDENNYKLVDFNTICINAKYHTEKKENTYLGNSGCHSIHTEKVPGKLIKAVVFKEVCDGYAFP